MFFIGLLLSAKGTSSGKPLEALTLSVSEHSLKSPP